jgi:hypothetical protein
MSLSVPKYLEASNCQDGVVRYAWDDWQDLPEMRSPDEELVARLKRVSQRAVLAIACGSAEWIVYRFDRLCDTTAPWSLIESAWAMIVHLRYSVGAEAWSYYSRKGWEGPVKGPIRKALQHLESAFYLLASEYQIDPAPKTAGIFGLTCYVMSDPTPYREWTERVLQRFEVLYPRNPADELGDVVPREAINPDSDFHVEQTETLINRFLARLDYGSNIFLNPPEEILEPSDEHEFVGSPYVFDIEQDRQARRDSKAPGHHH